MQDKALVLDEKRAVSAGASTKTLLDDAPINTGYPFIGETRINEDVTGGTMTVEYQVSDTEDFTKKFVIGSSGEVAVEDMKKGMAIRVPLSFNPKKYPYLRAYYNTSATGGKITTVLQPAVQTNMEK